MATHEERTARALAQWLKAGREDKKLERAVLEQLEESAYWERKAIFERIDGLADRYIGDSHLPPAARNAGLELIGEMKSLLKGRQHRDDARDRLYPDWRTENGARVHVPQLNRAKRPWPDEVLPPGERHREARVWGDSDHVAEAPGTYSARSRS